MDGNMQKEKDIEKYDYYESKEVIEGSYRPVSLGKEAGCLPSAINRVN
jgi:hypothetical protein